ncbi:MAG: PepSY domain-containing protein, partial [Micrococcales bacterium]|nr:PepSY domain-containing protein [Micrococcales bacterium]
MKTRTIRAWSWVHKWSSLVSTAFLLMLCITGLPLVFTHELNHVLLDEAWAPADPDGERLNLDQVLAVALSRQPGDVPAFMSFDEDRPVVNVTSRAPEAPSGQFN